jgi:hypothetical protein
MSKDFKTVKKSSILYHNNSEVLELLAKPIAKDFMKNPNISSLKEMLTRESPLVSAALYDEIEDTKKIENFLEKFYDMVNNSEEHPLGDLYDSLLDLTDDVIKAPKEADGRWLSYKEVHQDCKYMHLLAFVLNEVDIDTLGNTDIQCTE